MAGADSVGPVKRAAVIVHPGKHDDLDGFRSIVHKVMADQEWAEPFWLETSQDDHGEGQARSAVAAGVDLVLVSGGDGTVAACAVGLSGTRIPLGVLPCGTGNLLARNLGVPLGLDEALAVALTGTDMPLDVGEANGRPFVVMAGLGFDAAMLAGASDELKRRVGWVAYVLSGLRHLWDRPVRVVLRADDGPPVGRWASGVIVGNVGTLQGGVRLLPDARPDDGVLDVVVIASWGVIGWLVLLAGLLLRRRTGRLTRLTCRRLSVEVRRARPWEVDGDVIASGKRLAVRIRPARLLVRVPAADDRLEKLA